MNVRFRGPSRRTRCPWINAKTPTSAVRPLLLHPASEGTTMSLVRLLGFRTLTCGCVIGRYRELATSREVTYVAEKGGTCQSPGHPRHHTILAASTPAAAAPETPT